MVASVIKSQFKKISTFIFILIFLFIILTIFKLFYSWDGIRIILKFYIYILSFFIIFNFSNLDTQYLKVEFKEVYGKRGKFKLFFAVRLFPLLLIYFISVISTFLIYLDKSNWPTRPFLELLNGRYTHTFVYSLILLIILKLRKNPRIAIPLFVLMSAIYFSIYKLIYIFSPSGNAISFLKLFQILMIQLFLFQEFFFDSLQVYKTIIVSIVNTFIIYFLVVGSFTLIHYKSMTNSYAKEKSALVLLELGYDFPFATIENTVQAQSRIIYFEKYLSYATNYKKKIPFTEQEWQTLLLKNVSKTYTILPGYLLLNKICITPDGMFTFLTKLAKVKKAVIDKESKVIEYAIFVFKKNYRLLYTNYPKADLRLKKMIIDIFGGIKKEKSIPFLVDILTGPNVQLSLKAYKALRNITGLTFRDSDIHAFDIKAVVTFMQYYNKYKSR